MTIEYQSYQQAPLKMLLIISWGDMLSWAGKRYSLSWAIVVRKQLSGGSHGPLGIQPH